MKNTTLRHVQPGPGNAFAATRPALLFFSFVALYTAAFWGQGWGLSCMAWVAFVPLFELLSRQKTAWRFCGVSLLAGCTAFPLASVWFAMSSTGPLIYLATAWEAVMASVPFLLLWPAVRRWGFGRAVWLLPGLLSAWEFLFQQSGFTMRFVVLGYSQSAYWWLVQFADVLSTEGISLWVLALNAAAWSGIRSLMAKKSPENQRLSPHSAHTWAGIFALLLALPLAYSFWRISDYEAREALRPSTQGLHLKAIHTDFHFNADPADDAEEDAEMFAWAYGYTDSLAQAEQSAGTALPDAYVWPEAMFQFEPADGLDTLLQISVNRWQTPLLCGAVLRPSQRALPLNTVSLWLPQNPAPGPAQRYDKNLLAPFWEGLPDMWLPVFEKMGYRPRLQAGEVPSPVRLRNRAGEEFAVGTPICYEQQAPEHWALLCQAGADVFSVPAFDAWFGSWGREPQLSNIVRLRAIQTKRWVARVANGGATRCFDPLGRCSADAGTAATAHFRLKAERDLTLYARFPWLPLAFSMGWLLLGAAVCGRRGESKQTSVFWENRQDAKPSTTF